MHSTFLAPAFGKQPDYDLASASRQESQNEVASLAKQKIADSRSPWEMAIEIFNNNLPKDDKKQFSLDSCPQSSLDAFMEDVSKAKNEAQKNRSRALDKINAIVERIAFYQRPIDTLAQTNQEMLIAWGTMKFLMHIITSEKKATDKLSEAIADIIQIFGRCEQYTILFSSHRRVIKAVGTLYADVLNLLVRATKFYKKSGISKEQLLSLQLSAHYFPERFASIATTPFEIRFAP